MNEFVDDFVIGTGYAGIGAPKENTLVDKKKEPHFVVKIEAAFPTEEFEDAANAVTRALEDMRAYGAARVVGSEQFDHDPFEDPEWREKQTTFITLLSPVTLLLDKS